VRCQFQRAFQRPDGQVAGAALQAREPETIQCLRVLSARAVPVCYRRGCLRQVIEPGGLRGARHQPRYLA
jgi:hypothetical protein